MLMSLNPHCSANALQSSRRAMEPIGSSGLTISHNNPASGRPVSLQRSVYFNVFTKPGRFSWSRLFVSSCCQETRSDKTNQSQLPCDLVVPKLLLQCISGVPYDPVSKSHWALTRGQPIFVPSMPGHELRCQWLCLCTHKEQHEGSGAILRVI